MPYEDAARHAGPARRRTVEHRLAGGHHRKQGCLHAAVAVVAIPAATIVLAAGYAVTHLNIT